MNTSYKLYYIINYVIIIGRLTHWQAKSSIPQKPCCQTNKILYGETHFHNGVEETITFATGRYLFFALEHSPIFIGINYACHQYRLLFSILGIPSGAN